MLTVMSQFGSSISISGVSTPENGPATTFVAGWDLAFCLSCKPERSATLWIAVGNAMYVPIAEDSPKVRLRMNSKRRDIMQFAIGDRVELKSGGPEMTVQSIEGSTKCYCAWFNKDGASYKLEGSMFIQQTLKKIG
jgi:uncharacterized protein YodC (DUF2158 family)